MALVVKDRVRETSVTQGTGTFTLDGAVTGYQSFSAIGNGNTTYYTIYLQASNEWEVGIGTYTSSGTTLSRDTILASSNGGSVVNFSAGTKDVFVTYPAGRSVYYDTATNVTVNQLSATTVDTTNIEVTNIKAKDGTAALSIADSTGVVSVSANPVLSGGTANGVLYLNGSKSATSGSALTFDGTNFANTQSANASLGLRVTNSNAGSSTSANTAYSNGSDIHEFGTLGTAYGGYGVLAARDAYIYAASTRNISLASDGGAIKFGAGTGAIEQMRLTSTGLGIGTSSPGAKLHASLAGANALILENTGNGGVYARWKRPNREYYLALDINNNGGTDFSLYDATAAATRLTLDASGNLGLGVTPSAWTTFRVAQIGAGAAVWGHQTTVSEAYLSANMYYDGNSRYISSGAATYYSQSAGAHYWATAPSWNGTGSNIIPFSTAMTLDASGNLGIGETNPGSRLHVKGSGELGRFETTDATGSNYLTFRDASAIKFYFGYTSAVTENFEISNVENGALVFGTNNAERARITSGGSLELKRASNSAQNSVVFNTTVQDALTLDSSGNLGLGVAPSAWGTSSQKAIEVILGALSYRGAGNTESTVTHGAYYDGTNWKYAATSVGAARYQMIGANAGSTHTWSVAAGGTKDNNISFSTAMTLDASGRLGLGGVTNPSVTLDIGGTSGTLVRIGTGTGNGSTNFWPVIVGDGSSAGGGSNQTFVRLGRFSNGAAGIDAFEGGVGNAALAFGTYETERARITSGGDFVIGDTSASYRLDVKGSTGNGIAYRDGTVTNYLGTTGSNLGYLGTLTNHPVAFLTNATEKARIDTSGNVSLSTNGSSFQWINSGNNVAINATSGVLSFYTGTSSYTERARITSVGGFETRPAATGHAVFNEDSVDADFRVESDTSTHMLFVDAGNNCVNINTSSNLGGKLNVSGAILTDQNHKVHYALPTFHFGAGGINDEYWVVARRYVGSATAASGLAGQIIGSRGSTGTGNVLSRQNVNIQSAYLGNALHGIDSLGNEPNFVAVDIISISGVEYYALRGRPSGGECDNGLFFEGFMVNNTGDTNVFARVRASDSGVSVVTTNVETVNSWAVGDTYLEASRAGFSRVLINGTETVVNDSGADYDFRVESDNNTHMLYVDAGNNTIGVMTSAPTAPLEINSIGGLGGYTALKIKFGSTSVQSLSMGQVTAGNGAWIGTAQYRSAGQWQTEGTAASIIGMDSAGILTIYTNSGLTANTDFVPTQRLTIPPTIGAVFNEDGLDYDFRVESDTDTHCLFVDASANNVGIGTSSPTNKLDVSTDAVIRAGTGGTPSTGGTLWLTTGSSTGGVRSAGIRAVSTGAANSHDLVFLTNGDSAAPTERARITSDGNLLVGTTTPAYSTSGRGLVEVNGSSTALIALKTSDTARGYFGASSSITELAANGASQPLVFTTNSAERARITSSGNFGIGETNPSAPLHVKSTDVAFTANTSYDMAIFENGASGLGSVIQIVAATNGVSEIGFSDTTRNVGLIGYDHTNNYMVFVTNSTERARITSGGYFKASNDGVYAGSGADYHELRTTGVSWTLYAQAANATAANCYGISLEYSAAAPNGTGNEFIKCYDNAATRAAIRSNGGLANYQSNNVDLSDIRTKTDISPLASYWSKIAALEIVSYKYKDQTHDDLNIGVIAQQVEQVAPEFVDADGFGETPEDGVPLKTIYNKDLTFAAIKALQEAMARIEQLEAKVAALEGK